MKRRMAVILALATVLLGTTLAGTASARIFGFGQRADFSGFWKLDQVRGYAPGYWDRGTNQERGPDNFHRGGWESDDRSAPPMDRGRYRDRGDYGDRGVMRGGFLPPQIRIDQRRHILRIADSKSRILEQIAIGGGRNSSWGDRGFGATGHWHGSVLEVERVGPRGAHILQTFALGNRSRTLVIRTRMEGGRSQQALEMERVYRRA